MKEQLQKEMKVDVEDIQIDVKDEKEEEVDMKQ
jgi:hypothetical protein